jgi:hypothetical protein
VDWAGIEPAISACFGVMHAKAAFSQTKLPALLLPFEPRKIFNVMESAAFKEKAVDNC